MSPRFLSEPEAWREIAREVESVEHDDRKVRFLCNCTEILSRRARISVVVRDAMLERIREHKHTARMKLLAAWGDQGIHANAKASRVLAALFLALEAEDEPREAKAGAQ